MKTVILTKTVPRETGVTGADTIEPRYHYRIVYSDGVWGASLDGTATLDLLRRRESPSDSYRQRGIVPVRVVPVREAVAERDRLNEEVEALRGALRWACERISEADISDGEEREDWEGATRLAWPEDPENWS
jgi:hypothetical protein